MADYPSVAIFEGFRQTASDGRQVDAAADGLARIRILFAADRMEFIVPHALPSASDLSTLRSFYATYRASSFNFTSPQDGVTYVVGFIAPYDYTFMGGGSVGVIHTVTAHLKQTA